MALMAAQESARQAVVDIPQPVERDEESELLLLAICAAVAQH
jgi:hypothetical protein